MTAPMQVALRRVVSLPMLILYGLGTTVGAGIYVLVGKVAARAGLFTPVAFLVAAVLAGVTAFAFAELSARYPHSAGASVYVREGLGSRRLAVLIGLLVVLAGVVSAATIVSGSVGYITQLRMFPEGPLVIALAVGLGLIAAWGIGQSVMIAGLVTLLEVAGLILVIWVGLSGGPMNPVPMAELVPPLEAGIWVGIFSGAFLAFYAFIGFEDMVNVAEEVKNVTSALPVAILVTLALTGVIYVALAYTVVVTLPVAEAADSTAPLALIYARSTGSDPIVITVIGIFATLNGALVQIIMGSRVLYGLAKRGWLPAQLARVHPRTQTPLLTTAIVTLLVLLLALGFGIVGLAGMTAMITLAVFALVNAALVRIKRRDPAPEGIRVFPIWLPITGFCVSLGFLVMEVVRLVVAA